MVEDSFEKYERFLKSDYEDPTIFMAPDEITGGPPSSYCHLQYSETDLPIFVPPSLKPPCVCYIPDVMYTSYRQCTGCKCWGINRHQCRCPRCNVDSRRNYFENFRVKFGSRNHFKLIVNEESGLLSRQMGSTIPFEYFSKELAEQGKMNCYWPNTNNTEYLAMAVEKRRIFWMGNMDYTPCNNRFPEKMYANYKMCEACKCYGPGREQCTCPDCRGNALTGVYRLEAKFERYCHVKWTVDNQTGLLSEETGQIDSSDEDENNIVVTWYSGTPQELQKKCQNTCFVQLA